MKPYLVLLQYFGLPHVSSCLLDVSPLLDTVLLVPGDGTTAAL